MYWNRKAPMMVYPTMRPHTPTLEKMKAMVTLQQSLMRSGRGRGLRWEEVVRLLLLCE